MRYLIAVHAAPLSQTGGAASALRFCTALYTVAVTSGEPIATYPINTPEQHSIAQIFFYGAGVHNLDFSFQKQEQHYLLPFRWQEFSLKHNVPLKACIQALATYGVSAADGYTAGLGEFFAASTQVDRVLIFK